MLLASSLWLLPVCLLFWFCDAKGLVYVDPDSESTPLPVVIWIDVEIFVIMVSMTTSKETPKSGTDVESLQHGNNTMKDVENQVLDACSQLCQSLAQDPKLQHGYIIVAYFSGCQLL
ncbi:palmitoyl-protein thioesterase 1-like [Mus musculus]|uniref:palmitoyl-protein thioesterase 1-like n=1 Tax=Mus musculus TaxID=10090 RepID=UPI0001E6B74B|nr:palmitoyl-protein thioesterase 1-like [Mus musculus]|eukprot:XP_003084636.1 PREDICTED: palmitoyl-protein thioesterase 1-like [Mus musculus]